MITMMSFILEENLSMKKLPLLPNPHLTIFNSYQLNYNNVKILSHMKLILKKEAITLKFLLLLRAVM